MAKAQQLEEAEDFCRYIDSTPSPFQLVDATAARLDAAGFTRISESDVWIDKIVPGGKYYWDRNGSTLVAAVVGGKYTPGGAFKAVGAHTDSPVLKVKPVSNKRVHGYIQVGVECYGGGLWHTWFDRELTVAGRVIFENESGQFAVKNVHVKRPILRVPTLCIHLQTGDERKAFAVNKETHLCPIMSLADAAEAMLNEVPTPDGTDPRHPPLLLRVISEELGISAEKIKDLELSLCDTQPAQVWGVCSEFLSSPRLDNQVHCFTSCQALIHHAESAELKDDTGVALIALFDHEEVGSRSAQGAGSPIFRDAIVRLSESLAHHAGVTSPAEIFKAALARSMLLSADVAHAIHPNYASKHETNHQPLLNGGTVLKTNSSTRYATDGVTGFFFRELSRRAGEPSQEFVVRNDCACGTTIGPIIAANTGIRAADIGIASLSMHSIRETIGVSDIGSNRRVLETFFAQYEALQACFK